MKLLIIALLVLLAAAALAPRWRSFGVGDFIQLFATQVTTMNSTGNDLSPEMKTYYDKNLLRDAKGKYVFRQFGQKRPIPKGSGKTIEFRKFTPLKKALTPLTEGVTPAGNQLDVTAITATVAQYGDFITLSDTLELTAIDPIIVETTALLGDQATSTDDTVIRNELLTGTNVMYAPTWSGSPLTENAVTSRGALDTTAVLTVDLVRQVVAKLRAANVPTFDGSYVAIIHPLAAYDLTSDPEWKEMQKYVARKELFNGEIGEIHGCRFVETTEAKVWRGDDLASNSRTLTVNHSGGYSGAITSIAFDGGTVAGSALVGRKININGVTATITANTASALTFASTNFGTIADDALIYPGEGGKLGNSVFATLFLGRDAYGVTDLEGAALQTIVKQKGSGGTSDPLDQRSSVGWKETLTAKNLMQPWMLRVEHMSKRYSADTAAN